MTGLSKSRIVCAANKYIMEDGTKLIIPSARHHDPQMNRLLNVLKQAGVALKADPNVVDCQGFMDQHRNWISREDAYKIAEENGQIFREIDGCNGELFSENLY